MKITVAAVGRIRGGPEADLIEEYASRTRKAGRILGLTDLEFTDSAESRKPSAHARKMHEAAWLVSQCSSKSKLIALDERGKSINSEAFARTLQSEIDSGTSQLVFALGGPDGLAKCVHDRADLVISFGPMTWPHKLARAMLAEQIYRAVTILTNHPYHRA
jgi:23S rRNA (pseudouridine1915-N3)-methyltransferase